MKINEKKPKVIFTGKCFDSGYGLINLKMLEALKEAGLLKKYVHPDDMSSVKIDSCDLVISQIESLALSKFASEAPKTKRMLLWYGTHFADRYFASVKKDYNKYYDHNYNQRYKHRNNWNQLFKNEFKVADYYSVISDLDYESFVNCGIEKNDILIFPPGVDLRKFKPRKNFINDNFKVLWVGREFVRKGLIYLLEAWDKIGLKNAELVISTGGNAEPIPEILVKYINKNTNIRFIYNNHLSISDLSKLYASSSIFALPSLEEGYGMVASEAMACGCPVIVTKNCGVKEIVHNGKNGFIIDARNVKELAKKIKYFYNNPKEVKRMGNNAIKTAKNLSWTKFKHNFTNQISSLFNPL